MGSSGELRMYGCIDSQFFRFSHFGNDFLLLRLAW
jgi:hypothetical protein